MLKLVATEGHDGVKRMSKDSSWKELLPKDTVDELIADLEKEHDAKNYGVRRSNASAACDATWTMNELIKEVWFL